MVDKEQPRTGGSEVSNIGRKLVEQACLAGRVVRRDAVEGSSEQLLSPVPRDIRDGLQLDREDGTETTKVRLLKRMKQEGRGHEANKK